MGVVGATSSLASVVGAPLGGILVREFTWRDAILGYAAMAAFGAVLFWWFYRPAGDADALRRDHRESDGGSAFVSPVVWTLALIVGLGGFGQFTVTYFVPSVAAAVYGLDAAAAGVIISTGYVTAIVMNLVVGWLADRFNKVLVLGGVFVLLAMASASLSVEHLFTFRVATATVIGLGFTAANQLYALAGSVMPRREAGNAMGVVSLGAGLFGFLGPQLLGILRDWTGSFAAGFYMVATADVLTLGLIVLLFRMTREHTPASARMYGVR
jgi:Nitrate/nitrite transporter